MISIDKVLDAARNSSENFNLVDSIIFAKGYSESNEFDGKVAIADWSKRNNDKVMNRLYEILKKMGYSLEYSGEVIVCDCCKKAVRSQAYSHSWSMNFHANNGLVTCYKCLEPEEYLKSLEGDNGKMNTIKDINPADYGYVKQGYCSDDSKAIAERLKEAGHKRFLFHVDGIKQFFVNFSVWIHVSEISEMIG